jgi:imidazolonepropionase-like amidohydrolase
LYWTDGKNRGDNVVRFICILTTVLGLATAGAHAAPPAKVALQGGRIIPIVGDEIAQGTILIEHGKITAIGPQVEIPYDAMVVDTTGKVLMPGMIVPHTSGGLDRANENLPVTPFLDVYDALDPSSLFFEDALRDGHLVLHVMQGDSCVIGGLGRLVHPIGRTTDEMTIRPATALKLSTSPKSGFDRMTQMATMREAFLELAYYLENLAEQRYEAKLEDEEKELDVLPDEARKRGAALIRDEDLDDKHRNLVKLTKGRLDAWIYCGAAMDVAPAIQTAEENGFLERAVFVLGTDAYRAVDELKRVKRPVVLSAELMHRERDPITGELRETFAPSVIHQAGLPFALLPDADSSLAERYLTYQAARCVRHGIPRQAALEAITLSPAHMLGVGDRLGSLEVGKDGYVLVLSGDPLDFTSWVEMAFVKGVLAYERDKDVRLKMLLGLEQDAAEQAESEKPEDEPEEGDEAEHEKPEVGEGDKQAESDAEEAETADDDADREDGDEEEEDEDGEDRDDEQREDRPEKEAEQDTAGARRS